MEKQFANVLIILRLSDHDNREIVRKYSYSLRVS